MPIEEQVVSIYAATPQRSRKSWIRELDLADIGRYEQEMLAYMRSSHADLLDAIRSSGKLEDDVAEKLDAALDSFGESFRPQNSAAGAAA